MKFVNMILATLVYSGLSSTLQITGNATFRVEDDIRITDITIGGPEGSGIKGDALIEYEPTYTKDSITTGFTLPNPTSEITYKVTVDNKGDRDQTIYDFVIESTNNENIIYEVKEYEEKDVIDFKTEKVFYITFKTLEASDQVVNIRMKFDFREVYYITYETNGGSPQPERQIKYQSEDIILSTDNIEKRGYTFNGWKANEVNYPIGSIYNIDEDVIMYANLSANEYEITLDNQNATTEGSEKIYTKYDKGIYLDSSLSKEMTLSENPITIPTRSGDVFGGYYTEENGKGIQIIDENGYITENIKSDTYAENQVIYARWIDPVTPTATIKATKKNTGTEVATNAWSSEGLNFKITEETVGSSGATIYYCQDTTDTCDPNIETKSGNIITSYNNLEQDEYYIRYKIVSGEGLSTFKSYKARVDNIVPTLSMLGSGAYEMKLTTNIVSSVKYGISSGKVVCTNKYNNAGVSTLASIKALGPQEITCTASSGAGLSTADTRTYRMSYTLNLNDGNIGVAFGAYKESNKIIIPYGGTQFGPYMRLAPGCYHIIYWGTNLGVSPSGYNVQYNASNGNPNPIKVPIITNSLNYDNTSSSNYYFKLTTTAPDIEIKLSNNTGNGIITINEIRIEYPTNQNECNQF